MPRSPASRSDSTAPGSVDPLRDCSPSESGRDGTAGGGSSCDVEPAATADQVSVDGADSGPDRMNQAAMAISRTTPAAAAAHTTGLTPPARGASGVRSVEAGARFVGRASATRWRFALLLRERPCRPLRLARLRRTLGLALLLRRALRLALLFRRPLRFALARGFLALAGRFFALARRFGGLCFERSRRFRA